MNSLINIIASSTSKQNNEPGPIVGMIILAIILVMVFHDKIPTKANKHRQKLAQFEQDYSDFFGVDQHKVVIRWLNDCSAIVKKGEKEFVRIFKNDQGLFTEEPYPVFEGQEDRARKA